MNSYFNMLNEIFEKIHHIQNNVLETDKLKILNYQIFE